MNAPKTLCYFPLLLMVCGTVYSEEVDAGESKKEARLEEDALARAQFGFSVNDIFNKLVAVSCKYGDKSYSGNGFIAVMDGKTYLFTNQQTLLGAETISFKTATGKILRPRRVELSTSRDIARLLLADGTEGFGVTADIPMDSAIGVFGNNDPDEGEVELYGKITGVGADIVEVSADFVSENSGSPVLNLDQEVIGIASYVRVSGEHGMKTGTKFENKTRHFCYRLANTRWKSVNWKKYNSKCGKFYHQNKMFTDGIIEVFINWGDTPMERINIEENPERTLVSWVKSHNEIIIGKSNQKKRTFASEYSESLKRLSKKCSNRARQIRLFSEQPELTDFLRDELDTQSSTLEYAVKTLDRISNTAQDYR